MIEVYTGLCSGLNSSIPINTNRSMSWQMKDYHPHFTKEQGDVLTR